LLDGGKWARTEMKNFVQIEFPEHFFKGYFVS
jgi:hypothetical protein